MIIHTLTQGFTDQNPTVLEPSSLVRVIFIAFLEFFILHLQLIIGQEGKGLGK